MAGQLISRIHAICSDYILCCSRLSQTFTVDVGTCEVFAVQRTTLSSWCGLQAVYFNTRVQEVLHMLQFETRQGADVCNVLQAYIDEKSAQVAS